MGSEAQRGLGSEAGHPPGSASRYEPGGAPGHEPGSASGQAMGSGPGRGGGLRQIWGDAEAARFSLAIAAASSLGGFADQGQGIGGSGQAAGWNEDTQSRAQAQASGSHRKAGTEGLETRARSTSMEALSREGERWLRTIQAERCAAASMDQVHLPLREIRGDSSRCPGRLGK